MSKYKGNRKRKNNEYDLETILDEDDASNDADASEPKAAARNAEKNDETVS
jgi:hypothetical protein